MKRLLCLIVLSLAVGAASRAALEPGPARLAGPTQRDYQDIIYFADARPILIRLHVTVDGKPLSARWDDYVTKVFKYLDANGDGVLDKNEIQRVPSPDVLFGGSYGGVAPTLADLDANGDGKVTRDELAAWFRRLGATPFQVATGGGRNDQSEYRIELLLAQEELALATGRLGSRGGNTDDVNEALFKLLDTNGDGKLSKEELAAAPAILLKRDRNDDEMITRDEIVSGAGRGGDDYESFTRVKFAYALARQGNQGAGGPFWTAHPGASRAELARRLVQQYAAGSKKGQAAPTKLSRQDVGLDEAAFAKLDVDGDGFLDTEELARFDQRPPDLELNVDLGKKAAVELVKRGAPLEANIRAGRDGVLMLEMNGTRLDLKGLAAQKVDAALAAKQEREQFLAEFKRADRDNNGYLDMAEAMRSPLYGRLFRLMDRDGDGMLFEKEVIAYLDTYQDLTAAARASCATVGITSEGKGLFELMDTDGDGRLSVREMRNAFKLIAELDRDGDGLLSRIEIPRCTQATFRMGPAAGGDDGAMQARFVARSGRLGGYRPQPAKPARGPEWFRKMDRNGDGDVSRREFLGTDEQFRAINTNGDGLISVEEAEAYEQKMREKK